MKRYLLPFHIAVWAVGMLPASPALSAPPDSPTWQYGLSFSYLTGDYGQPEDTDILYTAATVKRYFAQGDVTLTIPYLDVSDGGVSFIDGGAEVFEGGGGVGLGDIILKGRYYAVQQEGPWPFIDLVGSVKIPTADEDKGLGTGEADFTVMAEFARRLENEDWMVLADVGYTFVGEPSGYDVDNRWRYSLGLAYQVDPKLTVSSYLDGRTAIFEGKDDPLSILLIGQYKFRPSLYFDAMVEFGLNDGAADFGITFGVRKRM